MRVLIGGFGTRGDVQPMVVLAKTLMARGHQVTTAVSPNSMPLTDGLEVLPVGMSCSRALCAPCASESMRARARTIGASMKRDGAVRIAELIESL